MNKASFSLLACSLNLQLFENSSDYLAPGYDSIAEVFTITWENVNYQYPCSCPTPFGDFPPEVACGKMLKFSKYF